MFEAKSIRDTPSHPTFLRFLLLVFFVLFLLMLQATLTASGSKPIVSPFLVVFPCDVFLVIMAVCNVGSESKFKEYTTGHGTLLGRDLCANLLCSNG